MEEQTVQELLKECEMEICTRRSQILNDFAKAYLAHLPPGTSPMDIVLNEHFDGAWKWHFELKESDESSRRKQNE